MGSERAGSSVVPSSREDKITKLLGEDKFTELLQPRKGVLTAVLSHGLVKEDRVPPNEIDRAVERKHRFDRDPTRHTFAEE